MYTADTLSRSPLPTKGDSSLEEPAELAIDERISHLPAYSTTRNNLEQTHNDDPVCSMVIKYCRDGRLGKTKLNEVMLPYWEAHSQRTLKGNLLLYGNRIVIPATKQQEILGKIHEGHQ